MPRVPFHSRGPAVDDLIQEFLVESNENLDRYDTELVKLEGEPGSQALLSSIFRSIHSIKGACGFLGFQKLEKPAHAGENLLSKLRDGQLTLTPEIGSALLVTGDSIRQVLAAIGATGADGDEEFLELIERLKALQEGAAPAPGKAAPKAEGAPAQKKGAAPPQKSETNLAKPEHANAPAEEIPPQKSEAAAQARKKKHQPQAGKLGGTLVERQRLKAEDLERGLEAQEGGDVRPIGEILVSMGAVSAPEVSTSLRMLEEQRAKAAAQDSTIRVHVNLLDKLMNLVGELVLARNQILQFAGQQEDTAFVGTLQRLNLVTTELRESVMKTRMQPISRLFDKVPRVARDVSMACGKQVRVETEGKETELDRTLLEAMNDPLTHLVRNAIDHGVESPEKRVAAGKSAEGLLRLRALHEGGQVTIEISDDGAGIDVERIRKKAVDRGVVTAELAARMGPQEALNLIMLPGVSTAEKVTNVSGRGVGMDVVKTNIEHVGGSIEIQTQLGRGTTFRVRLPLTLAIVPALIVRCAGRRFAIPQVNLVELVRAEADKGGIELVHDVPVYRLRGRLLPLVPLSRELHLEANDGEAKSKAAVNIVVLQVDSRQFGLVVDEVHDTEEIVVKPLGKHFKSIKAYAGATIMGDGKPVLILDVPGLAQSAAILTSGRDEARIGREADSAGRKGVDSQKFVLFTGPGGSRMALPLHMLARLEELPPGNVERSGNQWVAQYRGQILPLIRVSHALEERRESVTPGLAQEFPPSRPIQVLVLNHEGHAFGLVVPEILDIVEDAAEVQATATRAGVLYSAVIADRVTELLDVAHILQSGEIYGSQAAQAAGAGQ
jgi:two-component system chemotaxis sensor kinase CheA